MTEAKDGIRMARSKAGHDRGKVFVIVREDPEYFYLADGVSRRAADPKKKNRKHVQIINRIPAQVLAAFTSVNPFQDTEIRKALKLYNRMAAEQEE